jgi:hypothetical protein
MPRKDALVSAQEQQVVSFVEVSEARCTRAFSAPVLYAGPVQNSIEPTTAR